ncbi:hypothetical protein K458DRAFT_418553 [Lentithecium fluviatile CBS 122367]|uniref:Uncharacterized protein n=1 Tax=Lentithecium fluviatile CBS 122367 TaxID=1168545 RepID=A0A6G1IZP3_9PLEO|nr:hypothetical protein K458DRAFT_418553 [Lentithecium fluviatile CBS 122367]
MPRTWLTFTLWVMDGSNSVRQAKPTPGVQKNLEHQIYCRNPTREHPSPTSLDPLSPSADLELDTPPYGVRCTRQEQT